MKRAIVAAAYARTASTRMKPRATQLLAVRGEQRVVGERHLRHRAAPEALLRHEGEAQRAALRRHRGGPTGDAVQRDRVARRAAAARPTARPSAPSGRCRTRRRCRRSRRRAPRSSMSARATCRTDRRRRARAVARTSAPSPRVRPRDGADAAGRRRSSSARASTSVSWRGSHSPVTVPPRSTVARVAQRADLVELVADVEDAAAFGRRAGAASRTASRPPAASAPTSARP